MVLRKLLSRLKDSRKGGNESPDPTVSPRPWSLQLGFRPSQSTPPSLRRQKSEGKQRRWSIRFEPALTVSFGRNRWNSVTNSVRFRPSPPRSRYRREQARESLELCRQSRRCIRKEIEQEVDCIRLSRTRHRCLHSSQLCGQRPLCRPKIFRCAISLYYLALTPLTFEPANDGESRNDRIPDTTG